MKVLLDVNVLADLFLKREEWLAGVDAIITRDAAGFTGSPIDVDEPREFAKSFAR